jgi:hypothetical protein
MRSKSTPMTLGIALAAHLLAAPSQAQEAGIPVVRFHVETAAELLQTAYPERYGLGGAALEEDLEWAREHAGSVTEGWDERGPLFLQRLEDLAGLPWPARQIDVYLVRVWPVVSIEHPLVLALDAIRAPGGREVPVPEDEDVRSLLLDHQLAHQLLDDPDFLPEDERAPAYGHPLMSEGDFAVEALVNWLVYRTLEDMWGEERLERAASNEVWRAYNPSHGFVVDELEPRHRLSRTATLADWLAANPEGSEIFRVREAYLRQANVPVEVVPAERERTTGSEAGIDLGATYEGRIFVAYVDEGSPAARVGVLEGDVVRTIEGRLVGSDVAAAQAALDASWRDDAELNLSVEREGEEIFFTLD